MSDSDARPDAATIAEGIMDEIRGATAELRVTEESGIKLLTGSATVSLTVQAHDVATPQEAVDVVVRNLIRQGINSFTFVVADDETGENFLVQDGVLFTAKEARDMLEDKGEEAGDDPGREE